jgi:hypothetical protein
MQFKKALAVGKTGESKIAKWLISRGNHVLPVYEIAENQFKGPALYYQGGSLVAPDMVVFDKCGNIVWLEIKAKSAFTWHRKSQRFVTGIDLRHYLDYLQIAKTTGVQVWLLFLHRSGIAKDTPLDKVSPVGLFGENILVLETCENHRHDNWGKSGMVYWASQKLRLIAKLDDVENRVPALPNMRSIP